MIKNSSEASSNFEEITPGTLCGRWSANSEIAAAWADDAAEAWADDAAEAWADDAAEAWADDAAEAWAGASATATPMARKPYGGTAVAGWSCEATELCTTGTGDLELCATGTTGTGEMIPSKRFRGMESKTTEETGESESGNTLCEVT